MTAWLVVSRFEILHVRQLQAVVGVTGRAFAADAPTPSIKSLPVLMLEADSEPDAPNS